MSINGVLRDNLINSKPILQNAVCYNNLFILFSKDTISEENVPSSFLIIEIFPSTNFTFPFLSRKTLIGYWVIFFAFKNFWWFVFVGVVFFFVLNLRGGCVWGGCGGGLGKKGG